MNDLFDSFGIDLETTSCTFHGPVVGEKAKPITCAEGIDDKEFLKNYERISMKMRQSDFFQNLSISYLNRCYELSKKYGKFRFVCVRCFKPIGNPQQLVEEQHSHLLYGRNCYSSIFRRQSNLVYQFDNGVPTFTNTEELQQFECTSCGRLFPAKPSNVPHCGINPRCCYCCTYNTLKYKGHLCPFERAFNIPFREGC